VEKLLYDGSTAVTVHGVTAVRLTHWDNHVTEMSRWLIYLLTAVGFPSGGSSTVHIYTQTVQRTTQNKQHIEQHYFESRGSWIS